MRNILIVYGSLTGTTTEIATRMKEILEGEGCTVDLIPASEKRMDTSKYDLVIVGSTIRGAQPKGGAKEFIALNRESLSAKKLAVFIVCITITSIKEDRRKAAEAYPEKITAGLTAVSTAVFAGRAPSSGWFGNWMGKKILGIVPGDFVDWDKINCWTLSLLDHIK